jgi:argonaute-like protein implicated in RNA metabolism and viral defense
LEKRLKSFLENVVIHKTDVSELLSWKHELAAHYTSANNDILTELKNKIKEIVNA